MENKANILRTQIPREKFSEEGLVWLPALRTIDNIISELSMPVLVKVANGFMMNQKECIESDTILRIHGYRRMEKFEAVDDKNHSLKIPLTCKHKVIVRPDFAIPLCHTVKDICKLPKIPEFITNEKEFRSRNKIFPAFTTFSVKTVHKRRYLSADCVTQKDSYETKLPASTKGDFRGTVHPNDSGREFTMEDLRDRDLPLSVQFQQLKKDSKSYSPLMGEITLNELIINDVVYATNYDDGRRLLITFSRNIDIELQVGHFMAEEDGHEYSTIAEPTEDPIDNEALEHVLHLDPYSGDYISVDYGAVMRQLSAVKGGCHIVSLEDVFPNTSSELPPLSPKKPPRTSVSRHSLKNDDVNRTNLPQLDSTTCTRTKPGVVGVPLPHCYSLNDWNSISSSHASGEALSIGCQEQKGIEFRPSLVLLESQRVSRQQAANGIHHTKGANKIHELPRMMSLPANLNLKTRVSAEPRGSSQYCREISSQINLSHNLANKDTNIPNGTAQINTTSISQQPAKNGPIAEYEVIESPNQTLRNGDPMMSKQPAKKGPSAEYEEIPLPNERLPTGDSMMSKQPVKKGPNAEYEEIPLPNEMFHTGEPMMSKQPAKNGPSAEYEEIPLPNETLRTDEPMMSKQPAKMVPSAEYEVIESPKDVLRTVNPLISKNHAKNGPSTEYEEIPLPNETLRTCDLMMSKQPAKKMPCAEYEEIPLPNETLLTGDTMMSKQPEKREPSAEYEEIPSSKETLGTSSPSKSGKSAKKGKRAKNKETSSAKKKSRTGIFFMSRKPAKKGPDTEYEEIPLPKEKLRTGDPMISKQPAKKGPSTDYEELPPPKTALPTDVPFISPRPTAKEPDAEYEVIGLPNILMKAKPEGKALEVLYDDVI